MYRVSDRFKSALKDSHTIATKTEVYVDNMYVRDLDLIDGNITLDNTAIRWSATLTLTDSTGELIPATGTDLLAPKGTEIQLYRGLAFPDGTQELVPLGRYGISSLSIDDSGQGLHFEIRSFDRARKIQRARMPSNGTIAAGTNYVEAMQAVLLDAMPSIEMQMGTTLFTTPTIPYLQGDDPWALVTTMANSIGCDIYFNEMGILVLEPVNPTMNVDHPEFTYAEGPDCTLLYLNKAIEDDNAYSHVVVTGESDTTAKAGAPARGEAFDTDPASPTYITTYGDVPYFLTSSFITTDAQAIVAAQKLLLTKSGLSEHIQLLTTVDPTIRLNDKVKVVRKLSHVNKVYDVSKITFPMVHDRGMNISTSAVRLMQ